MDTFLIIFLMLNMFLIGALSAVGVRHARAHYKPDKHDGEKHRQPTIQLPPAVKQELLLRAQEQYQSVLDGAARELQRDLKATATTLTAQLDKLGNDIVTEEMKRYRESLDKLRETTEATMSGAQSAVAEHQAELETAYIERRRVLEAQLAEEISAEKSRLLAQIDTKLADATASFLLETLQHNVDLGAQTSYLTAQLEAHKDEFKREIDETPVAK